MRLALLLLVLLTGCHALTGCRAAPPDRPIPAEATADDTGADSVGTDDVDADSDGVAEAGVADVGATEAAIRAVLDAQVAAWNGGSVRGFMEGYAQTDSLRFASRGTVRTGWDETLAGYERNYPDAAAMGTLTFADLDVRVLSRDWAVVFGSWRLDRAADTPSGLFTLTMQRRPEGWRVLYDHTSSAE